MLNARSLCSPCGKEDVGLTYPHDSQRKVESLCEGLTPACLLSSFAVRVVKHNAEEDERIARIMNMEKDRDREP